MWINSIMLPFQVGMVSQRSMTKRVLLKEGGFLTPEDIWVIDFCCVIPA